MKQTSVDYIKEKLMCDEYWYENMTFEQIFEQAKEMELDKLQEAYSMGRTNKSIKEFNETFKQQEQ